MTISNFYQKLLDAGLPVVSANDDGDYKMSRALTDAEIGIFKDIIDPSGRAARIRFDNPLNLTEQRAYDRLFPSDGSVFVELEPSNKFRVVSLTMSEDAIRFALSNPGQAEPIADRLTAATALLESSKLAGQNISTIKAEDRDSLFKAICYLVGICDAEGNIYRSPKPSANRKRV